MYQPDADNISTAEMVAQFAQQEQSMNAVERLLVYAELPPEGNTKTAKDPPPSWPEKGEIQFSDVKMAYRPGLPLVLKDVNFRINPGEKVCSKHHSYTASDIVPDWSRWKDEFINDE